MSLSFSCARRRSGASTRGVSSNTFQPTTGTGTGNLTGTSVATAHTYYCGACKSHVPAPRSTAAQLAGRWGG